MVFSLLTLWQVAAKHQTETDIPLTIRAKVSRVVHTQPWSAKLGGRVILYGFAAAVLSGVLLQTSAFGPGFESLQIARSLFTSGQFASPYIVATGPTAHMGPLFPALLAAILYCAGGNWTLFAVMATVLSAFAFALVMKLLPALTRTFWGDSRIGLLCAGALIVVPVFPTIGQAEAAYVAVLLAWFCLSVERGAGSLALGIMCGGVMLLSPAPLPFLAVYLTGAWRRKLLTPSKFVQVAFVAFGVCLPWMIRNEVRVGSFCLRDNLGLELQVNNNSFAGPTEDEIGLSYERYHPSDNTEQAQSVKSLGEVRYNIVKEQEAIEWIRSHKRQFVLLSVKRLLYFWFPGKAHLPFSVGVWLLTLASIPAVIFTLVRKADSGAFYLLLAMIAFSMPYCFILADLRYRLPVLWVTAVFACESVLLSRRWLERFSRWPENGGDVVLVDEAEPAV